LALLTLVSAFSYFDRGIFSAVLQSIKLELHVSDTVIGLVAGLVFVLFYTIAGVPIAYLADRYNRRNIVVIGLTLWSVFTSLNGFVSNIWQLGTLRFLMGAGEASSGAPSIAMVSDLYPREKRPFVISVLWSSSTVGTALALALGGWINQHYGWRMAFIVAGIPGILLALLLLFTTKDPVRGAADKVKNTLDVIPFRETVRFLFQSKTYIYVVLGCAMVSTFVMGHLIWSFPFMIRVHHFSPAQAGSGLGAARIISIGGYLLGGYLSARLSRIDARWLLWIPALAIFLSVPASAIFLLTDIKWLILASYAAMTFFFGMHFGPVYATCQAVSKIRMRSVSIAVFSLCINLFGYFVGPLVVGYMNDKLIPVYGSGAIRYSLLWMGIAFGMAGVLFLWMSAFYLVKDSKRAAEI
jgi:MFS family permease